MKKSRTVRPAAGVESPPPRHLPLVELLIRGLEAAFTCFGWVPQELLFDQMRTVVTADGRQDAGGLVINAEFLRFAEHWGFRARACRPYRAQTKGKVERPIRYCRQSFFYGRTFVGDDDLNDQAAHWCETSGRQRCVEKG